MIYVLYLSWKNTAFISYLLKSCGGKYEDTKWVIIICKSKKDRQHNGQKKNDKMTNNDLQNTTQKAKDRATRTLIETLILINEYS